MGKNDNIVFIFIIVIMVLIVPTWFDYGGDEINGYDMEYYVYMVTDSITIAVLVLCISFLVKEYFLIWFLYFFYLLKLSNLASIMSVFGDWEYNWLLDYAKVSANIVLLVWFGFAFYRFVKGWGKDSYI